MLQINEILKDKKFQVKKLNPRAEMIRFFVENIMDKNGKPYKPQFLAIKLSHIKTPDLHYSISIFKDTEKRRGKVAAQKEFFWSIKSSFNPS